MPTMQEMMERMKAKRLAEASKSMVEEAIVRRTQPILEEEAKPTLSAKDRFFANIKNEVAAKSQLTNGQIIPFDQLTDQQLDDLSQDDMVRNISAMEYDEPNPDRELTRKIIRESSLVDEDQPIEGWETAAIYKEKQALTKKILAQSTALSGSVASHPHLEGAVDVEVVDEEQLIIQATEIILNEKQMAAYDLAMSGKSFCLIGAAGTGKTTSMKKITRDLIDKGHIPMLKEGTKHLRAGHPGIAVLSFTNKAVNNIRRSVDQRIKAHTLTCHKLIEFRPVKYDIPDEEKGGYRTTMKFEPSRTAENPLPAGICLIIWEESSMQGTALYNMVRAALPYTLQEIFLGDIQQLPPVFGSAVLGFKMNELEARCIELTEVYRQALDSPIIKLAWKILEGNPHDFDPKVIRVDTGNKRADGSKIIRIECPALQNMNYSDPVHGSLEFRIWQTATDETKALLATQMAFRKFYHEGTYNPYKDIILCPMNIKYGTIEINKLLAQYFSILRKEPVHEIVAGYEKVYYAVGDRVLVGKEDAFIETIEPNPAYLGKIGYCIPSVYLDRWGIQQTPTSGEEILAHQAAEGQRDEEQAEYFLEGDGDIGDIEGDSRVNAASHIVTCRFSYSDEITILDSASQLKPPNFLGGYCLTVHKFQGSEEERVYILLHTMHAKMVRRELLYTAVTRARKHLIIMCENTSFSKGVSRQAIKGNTIAEKAEIFKGKLEDIKNDDDIPKLSEDLDINALLAEREIRGEDVHGVQLSGHNLEQQKEDPQPLEQQGITQSSSVPEQEQKELETPKAMTMAEKLKAMRERLRK